MKKIEELTFEDAFNRLNEIVEKLESGDLSLDQSIEFYEEGLNLKNHCEEKLKKAEIKIKKVLDKNKIIENENK